MKRVEVIEVTHKRSSTVGSTDKGKLKNLPLVGNIDGRRPVNVEDLGKIKRILPAKGCCTKAKREKM